MRVQRHNATVILIALLLCALVFVFAAGCSDQTAATEPEPEPVDRFDTESVYCDFNNHFYIITDHETGVQYLFVDGYQGVGVTKLEPAPETVEPEPEPNPEPEPEPVRYALTDAERALIESVVTAEAEGEPFLGQKAVAQCILNACEKDGIRPDEAIEVYQYSTNRPEPTDAVREAVSAVFDRGEVAVDDTILWFYAPARATTTPWHETQRYVVTIGGHKFFAEA